MPPFNYEDTYGENEKPELIREILDEAFVHMHVPVTTF